MNVAPLPLSIPSRTCKDIVLQVAATRAERQAAFELIYRSYHQSGLCESNHTGLRITPYQLLSTTDIYVAKQRDHVISTLSLVRDGAMGLPMEQTYPEAVQARRRAGLRLAEVTCLADRQKGSDSFFGRFCDLCQLMAQLAKKSGVDQLLAAVHPRHACIYRRFMGFEQVGGRREYTAVQGHPAIALCRDLNRLQIEKPLVWARFFGQPLPDEVLVSRPMTHADRDYFLAMQTESEPLATIPFPGPAMEMNNARPLAKCM